jgi:hypothetical protein
MYISFQTAEMEKLSVDPDSAKETDTIMSSAETLYSKKEVHVTMTSAWYNTLQCEFPCLVTIHTDMDGLTFNTYHYLMLAMQVLITLEWSVAALKICTTSTPDVQWTFPLLLQMDG